MARPRTKTELLSLSKQNFIALMDYIESMDVAEQGKAFPPGTMNRNIRDILMHLHHWHLLVLDWYETGMAGNKPDMPAKGYTWKATPQLNKWIWEKYKRTSLEKAKESFKSTYEQVRGIIESHSNEELFEKKRYKWTGSTSLGAYLVSATSSHYDWALSIIRRAKK